MNLKTHESEIFWLGHFLKTKFKSKSCLLTNKGITTLINKKFRVIQSCLKQVGEKLKIQFLIQNLNFQAGVVRGFCEKLFFGCTD